MTSIEQTLDKEELRSVVADVLDVEVSEVGDHTHFVDDLEVDSLMALEVVVVLEKKYRVRFGETELKRVTCLDAVHDLIAAKPRTA